MTIDQIKKAFPKASDATVAEIWLRDLARESSAASVKAEFGFDADANGEYTVTEEEAAKIFSA